mgnify:CR=1 FL=1
MPTFASLFDGIYGFGLALESAGFDPLWRSEIDKDCDKLISLRRPNVPNLGDIRKIHNAPHVDILTGGFPCQDISVAGKRSGLNSERSGLFFEMARIANDIRPTYLIWENVPGLLTSCSCRKCRRKCTKCGTTAGADDEVCGVCGHTQFQGRVLQEHRGADLFAIVSTLGFIGMDGAWTLLDAQYFGLAQRRRRLFGVFTQRHLGAKRCTEILSFQTRLSRNSTESREAGEETPRNSGTLSANRGGLDSPAGNGNELDFCVPTMRSNGDAHSGFVDDAGIVPFTLSGFGEYKEGVGTQRSNGGDYGGGSETLIALPITSSNQRINPETENLIAFDTLQQQGYNKASHKTGDANDSQKEGNPREVLRVLREKIGEEAFAEWGLGILYSLQQAKILRPNLHGNGIRPKAQNKSEMVSISPSSQAIDSAGNVREMWYTECKRRASQGWQPSEQFLRELGTYLSELSQPGTPQEKTLYDLWETSEGVGVLRQALSEIQEAWQPKNVQEKSILPFYGVRRLTPTEAERLQGFEDGWTEGFPDSTRYRMLGNSIAVPCVEWLAKRMAMQF